MTNKEKYKQAFSVLQSSGEISLEEERMAMMNKKAKMRTAAAAVAACVVLAGGSGIAYAADLGGIQRTIQLWINGDQTTATFEYDGEGTYHILYPSEDGEAEELGGGGVAFEEDGTERPLTEVELLDSLNDPEVEYKDDGTVWVLNIFKYIRDSGNISDEEMLRTFNCGVGFILVVPRKKKNTVMKHISQFYDCYEIGNIEKGEHKVAFEQRMNWL